MTQKFHLATTEMSVHREGESPLFDETAVKIRMDDDGGGAFFVIEHLANGLSDQGQVRVQLEELELIVKAARKMLAQPGLGEQE